MITFEEFKENNRAFGTYYIPSMHETEMQKCYAIAEDVERNYQQNYGGIDGPRVGDIVEFADDYEVYKHGMITEDMYGVAQYGVMTVCQHGSSHTDGKYFSTSGGSFVRIHQSKMRLVGEDYNMVWTWGCYGAGANQGIYFPLKVRRWLVPYEKPSRRSWVDFHDNIMKHSDAVTIRNTNESTFCAEHFKSIKAFMAWAEYVGFKYRSTYHGGSRHKISAQRIEYKFFTDASWQPPKGAKPMKRIYSGDVKDVWVVTTDDTITYYIPNLWREEEKRPECGSPEYERQIQEYWKYDGNPMGIEL